MHKQKSNIPEMSGYSALIIGGSGGIGRELALSLAKSKCRIQITGGNDKEKLLHTVEELKKFNKHSSGKLIQCNTAVQWVQAATELLPVEILIVSFGPFIQKKLHNTDPSDWDQMSALNTALPGALISSVLPHMQEKQFGRILLFGGTGTDQCKAVKTTTAYTAAKTALNVIVKSVAREYAKYGISCNIVCPGFVETEYYTEQDKEKICKTFGINSFINPKELADICIKDILLQKNGLYNGAIIAIDQGMVI
ncbi:MAG: SDR family NAD(P)-dependent oxidoreductase [Spirochaetia bacterium]